MKHFRKGLFVGAAISLLALTASAAVAETPKDQLVIGTSLAQVLSLDPQQATEGKANEIMCNLYDRLVLATPGGRSHRNWQRAGRSMTKGSRSSSGKRRLPPVIR